MKTTKAKRKKLSAAEKARRALQRAEARASRREEVHRSGMGYLRPDDLARMFGVSRQTIWVWQRRKKNPLPRPVHLGSSVAVWEPEVIRRWASPKAA